MKETEESPDFEGYVTGAIPDADDEQHGTILAESHANKMVNRCSIQVTAETVIRRMEEGRYQASSFSEIRMHDYLRVWFTSDFRETQSDQATAGKVEVFAIPP